ncbi:MAG: AAA family ATPase [Bacillota bacterium]
MFDDDFLAGFEPAGDGFWEELLESHELKSLADVRDPNVWLNEVAHEFAWAKQRDILNSVRDNRYTVVHSCHGAGKSFIASRIIAWWISTHPLDEVFVISTAPTAAQVAAIMWREVTKIHSKAKLPGKINRAGYPQWYVNGELVGYGRKPSDYEDSAFQGIHARYVLVVVDEAGGVVKKLYDAIDSIATNEHARVLAIGNPDDPASHHAAICKPDSGWNVVHIDALRLPNMTYDRVVGDDPENPKYPLTKALMEADGIPYNTEVVPDDLRELWTDERWVEERIIRWAGVPAEMAVEYADQPERLREMVKSRTENSALFTAKVRGRFPTSSSEGIIPIGWAQRAMERWDDLKHDRTMAKSLKATISGALTIGVDVARTGNDQSVITLRYGNYVHEMFKVRIEDTILLAEEVAKYMTEPGTMAVIDVIGLGSGVYDYLRKLAREGKVQGTPIPFNAAARSGRRDRLGQFQFRNDRAAAWWNMRELLDPATGANLAIPNDEDLLAELAAPRYSLFQSAIMTVEEKAEIRKRLGRSTDSADSIIQAFWVLNQGATVEGMPFEDLTKYAGRQTRGGVLNYDGEQPWETEETFRGLVPATMIAPAGVGLDGMDDVSTWWD